MTLHGFHELSRQIILYLDAGMHLYKCCTYTSFEKSMHVNQLRFMLYHERRSYHKVTEQFVNSLYMLVKFCNIFDGAFY